MLNIVKKMTRKPARSLKTAQQGGNCHENYKGCTAYQDLLHARHRLPDHYNSQAHAIKNTPNTYLQIAATHACT